MNLISLALNLCLIFLLGQNLVQGCPSSCVYNQICDESLNACSNCPSGCAQCNEDKHDQCITCINYHTYESNPLRDLITNRSDAAKFALSNVLNFTYLYQHACVPAEDCPAGTFASVTTGTCQVFTLCKDGEVETVAAGLRSDRECGPGKADEATDDNDKSSMPSLTDNSDWLFWILILLAILVAIILLCCLYRHCCCCCHSSDEHPGGRNVKNPFYVGHDASNYKETDGYTSFGKPAVHTGYDTINSVQSNVKANPGYEELGMKTVNNPAYEQQGNRLAANAAYEEQKADGSYQDMSDANVPTTGYMDMSGKGNDGGYLSVSEKEESQGRRDTVEGFYKDFVGTDYLDTKPLPTNDGYFDAAPAPAVAETSDGYFDAAPAPAVAETSDGYFDAAPAPSAPAETSDGYFDAAPAPVVAVPATGRALRREASLIYTDSLDDDDMLPAHLRDDAYLDQL